MGGFLQDFISKGMPIAIIDVLEVIQIYHDHMGFPGRVFLHPFCYFFHNCALIIQSGKEIRFHSVDHLLCFCFQLMDIMDPSQHAEHLAVLTCNAGIIRLMPLKLSSGNPA